MLDFTLLAYVLGPTSFLAIVAWWCEPRECWASIGMLVTAAGIVLYLPIRVAIRPPSGEMEGWGLLLEFLFIGGFLWVVHLGFLLAIGLLLTERIIARRKAARNLGRASDEIPSNG